MISANVLLIAALVAAGVLLLHMPRQLWPIVGAVAAGVQVLIRFGWLRLSFRGFDLWLALAIGLAVAGGMSWMKSEAKIPITAATVLTLVGAIQLLSSITR